MSSTHHIFKTYLKRLTNLSGNSRLLMVLRLSEQLLDVQRFSHLHETTAFESIKALIAGKAIKICPVLDSRREAVNEMSRALKRVQRVDKFIFDERGSNDLHVGWPFVRGKFSDDTLVRCPLLFFPVRLEQENGVWMLVPRSDAGIVLNKTFLLAYSFFNKVTIDEELLDTSFDDFDKESTAFRTELYELLKEKIELNFNVNTFTDSLLPFEEFRKEEFEGATKTGELKLFQEAVLGIFPQAGSQLVPDYLQLMDSPVSENLETFFGNRTQQINYSVHQWITTVKEESIYAPFSLDVYQEHALRNIKAGRSLVVQGPPGTGKSQLISNLIADGIASGKKVLLVCQKRVALDVVYDRLKKIKLGDFLGLVHDFRNDRKEIFEKIARQVERIEEYKANNRSIDSIQLERRFVQVCRKIDQLTETLEEFRADLFDARDCGLTAKELYLTSNPLRDAVSLKQEYREISFHSVNDVSARIKRYARYATILQTENHPWINRKSFSTFQVTDIQQIEKALEDIHHFQLKLNQELQAWLPLEINLEEGETLLQRQQEVEQMLGLLSTDREFQSFQQMVPEKDDETSLLWLQNMERVCLNCFDGEGIEASLTMPQLLECREALRNRMKARKNIFKMVWWELFSRHKFFLKRVVLTNKLQYNKRGMLALEQRIDNRLNLEHHLTALRQKTWLAEVPQEYKHTAFRNWFNQHRTALEAKLIWSSLRELKECTFVQKYSLAEFKEALRGVFTLLSTIPFQRSDWQQYLTPFQIRHILHDPESVLHYKDFLRKNFDLLCEFDRLMEKMPTHELEIVSKLHVACGEWNVEKFEELFQNSIRLAWLEHLEAKFPVLRSVSTFSMEEMEKELRQLVKEKQQLVEEIVLLRARERVYEHVTYNRLNNRITYRDLHHQVTKKRKIWPVRKVVGNFYHELFDLIPCWMASPESVSAIFPMEQLFDLVIFDEASQCFAERGLPSVFRGKQILVAGDSKQLKPFELYQSRWDDDTEHPDVEVDSLLELSERYMPSVQLQGHYRSKSLPLITFSNQHFYNNTLRLVPDRAAMLEKEPAIEFQKVNGQWEHQTNAVEAQAVVACAARLLSKNPEKEIGIITFNALQQMLITDLLEEFFSQRSLKIPSSLAIKNIENVQGDEKDVIIFSIGYAPDEKGKMQMQFGSLNLAGGENRLNVAVTRAREKVIVVSSIMPEDLRVEELKNEGPRMLKRYLEYARAVSTGTELRSSFSEVKHPSSWYLVNRLQQELLESSYSLNFPSPLPLADAAVQMNNELLGVILTDDELYNASLSVKEGHVYAHQLFEQKHWKHLRIYSRNWWLNSEEAGLQFKRWLHQLENE